MAATIPNFANIALQLETTTAQIRALSTLPESQREGKVMEAVVAVEAVKKSVEAVKKSVGDTKVSIAEIKVQMQEQAKKHGRGLQSLRDTTNNRLVAVEARSVHRCLTLQFLTWHLSVFTTIRCASATRQ
jgi:hypothetical protein